MSWTKAAQPNKLSSERSVGKPPCRGILSGEEVWQGGNRPSGHGSDVPPHTLKGFQCMREGLPKGVIPRLHSNIFPPTTTEIGINSWLEVITPTGEGGK